MYHVAQAVLSVAFLCAPLVAYAHEPTSATPPDQVSQPASAPAAEAVAPVPVSAESPGPVSSTPVLPPIPAPAATADVAPERVPGPPPPSHSDDSPRSGLLLQARMQTQLSLVSFVTSTSGFLVGYQFDRVALGAGLGLTRASYSQDHTDTQSSSSIDGTIFQITPTAIVDVWRSADRQTRANLVASVGFGMGSYTVNSESCSTGAANVRVCTANKKQSASAILLPLQLGFGGDHFLSRHFALGVEAGLQYTLATSIKISGQDLSGNVSMQAFYGLARVTMLIGE